MEFQLVAELICKVVVGDIFQCEVPGCAGMLEAVMTLVFSLDRYSAHAVVNKKIAPHDKSLGRLTFRSSLMGDAGIVYQERMKLPRLNSTVSPG